MDSGRKVHEAAQRVQCATGSCVSSAMSTGTTIRGGEITLGGGMAILGGGSATLEVGTGRMGGGGGVVVTGGTSDMARGVMVRLGIQLVMMSRRFEMVVSCLW